MEDSDLTFFVSNISFVTENDLLVSKAAMNLLSYSFSLAAFDSGIKPYTEVLSLFL